MQLSLDIRNLVRSLGHRNFRIFWCGQLISLVGTWMQTAAQAWLVLELTGSPLKLGVVSAMQFLPILLLSLVTAPLIDHFPKRRIIIVCQVVLMVQALVLAVLVWTDAVRFWHIVALAAVIGITNTIDMPARQSYLIELVGREDLMNAIGLNSAIFNAARALGPALAGLLIASLGTAFCFLLNGASYLAAIAGLARMTDARPAPRSTTPFAILRDIREALLHVWSRPVLFTTISLVSLVSVLAVNFNVLVPVFSRIELRHGPEAYGVLLSSFGFGALIGAGSFAYLSRYGPRPLFLFGSGAALSFFLVLLGIQDHAQLTMLLLALCGWCVVTFYGMANTTVQLNTEDGIRGRVMSIYTLSFAGLSPLGSLFAGSLAGRWNASAAFMISGIVSGLCILAAFLVRSGRTASSPETARPADP